MARWVVVGAGTAGCVVTRRLVEDGHDVVLVEAGPALPDPPPHGVAGDDPFALHGDETRIDPAIVARRTRRMPPSPYLRGRGVGGSSVVNAMIGLHVDPALPASWGWDGWSDAVSRIAVPSTTVDDDELGVVDRALLDATPDAAKVPLTRAGRRRVTSAEAYLGPVLASPHLTVVTDAAVVRVMYDDAGATGVVLDDGTTVRAPNVASCAGAIGSPVLLRRSGLDAGVGTGVQDHPSVAFTLEFRDPAPPSGLACTTVVRRDAIQILPLNHLGHEGDGRFGVVMVALMRPEGRGGTVTVGDDGRPVVDLDLLDHPSDRQRLADGVRSTIELLRTEPFRDVAAEVYVDAHGTTVDRLDPDSLETWMLDHVADYSHVSCSTAAALGPAGSFAGVDGLFVADASAFPTIPDVNTHLPTTVLAEYFVGRWTSGGRAMMR